MNQSNGNWYKENIDVSLEEEENNNLETFASPEEIKNPQDCQKKLSIEKDYYQINNEYRDERMEILCKELATVRKALLASGAEVHRKNRLILEKTIENRKASKIFEYEKDQLMSKVKQLEAKIKSDNEKIHSQGSQLGLMDLQLSEMRKTGLIIDKDEELSVRQIEFMEIITALNEKFKVAMLQLQNRRKVEGKYFRKKLELIDLELLDIKTENEKLKKNLIAQGEENSTMKIELIAINKLKKENELLETTSYKVIKELEVVRLEVSSMKNTISQQKKELEHAKKDAENKTIDQEKLLTKYNSTLQK